MVMAGNWGKFIDRSPLISAAGKPLGDSTQTVSECLKDYRLVDETDALKHEVGIFDKHRKPFIYKQPVLKNTKSCGIYTESKSVLQPPVKTRYQTLINDLTESSYASYWNKLDGRTPDPIPGLPAGMDTIQTTFGNSTIRETTMKDLINPPKTVYQVLWDSRIGHDMYKKTHHNYRPAEQIERGYQKPPFNPNKRYGERTEYDPRGIWVKCACHWHNNNPITSVNSIQTKVTKRQEPNLGKVLAPCKNVESILQGHRFGMPTNRPMYGMAELLRDPQSPPCLFKSDFYKWILHLNELRVNLKKRFNKFGFDFTEFQNHNLYFDKKHTGWIRLELFYHLCKCHGLHYQYASLEPLFTLMGVIKENMINYRDFVFLADINSSLPEIIKIEDVPKGSQYYISTALSAAYDYLKMDNSKMPNAGTSSVRYDLPRPAVPAGGCSADRENMGDETSAGAVVHPSIYTNYGLTYRDFFMPRSPETIKTIFENIGYTFSNESFQKLWKIGVECDKTGLVCIDTFKHLINETLLLPKFVVQDADKC